MSDTKTVDAKLDEVAIKQLTWKPTVMRDVAHIIVSHFLKDRIAWSDDVEIAGLRHEDMNCIGSAWRLLTGAGVIAPLAQFRRSTKEASKGRKVFKYRLASQAKAETWLARNGFQNLVTREPQLPGLQ